MFEYKVIEYKKPKFMEEDMNKMAKDGWRVISTACWHCNLVTMVVTYEREKK